MGFFAALGPSLQGPIGWVTPLKRSDIAVLSAAAVFNCVVADWDVNPSSVGTERDRRTTEVSRSVPSIESGTQRRALALTR